MKKILSLVLIAALTAGCAGVKRAGIHMATSNLPKEQQTLITEYLMTGKIPENVPDSIKQMFSNYQANQGQAPVNLTVGQPILAQTAAGLPTKTESEKSTAKSIENNSLIFTEGNRLFKKNLANGSLEDVTAKLNASYGPVINANIKENGLFFQKDGNFYMVSDDKVSLIAKGLDIKDYDSVGDYLVLSSRTGPRKESVIRIKKDGSGMKTVFEDTAEISSLDADVFGSEGASKEGAIFSAKKCGKKTFYLVDLKKGTYDVLFLNEPERIKEACWLKGNKIAFVRKDSGNKQDIYFATFENTSGGIPCFIGNAGKRLTYENAEDMSSLAKSGDGLLYVTSDGQGNILRWRPVVVSTSSTTGKPKYDLGDFIDLMNARGYEKFSLR